MNHGTLLAAIDLGSNSFRLEIGRYDHGQIQRVEYLKETVRQGNGLDENRNLTQDAMERGWACLARFAERLSGFKSHRFVRSPRKLFEKPKTVMFSFKEAARFWVFPLR